MTQDVLERFWTKTRRLDNGCIVWLGAKRDNKGYGSFSMNGKNHRSHRVAYSFVNGEIPINMVVMHACDRPSCVNPQHLSIGTQEENVKDMINKGRHWNKKVDKIIGG